MVVKIEYVYMRLSTYVSVFLNKLKHVKNSQKVTSLRNAQLSVLGHKLFLGTHIFHGADVLCMHVFLIGTCLNLVAEYTPGDQKHFDSTSPHLSSRQRLDTLLVCVDQSYGSDDV